MTAIADRTLRDLVPVLDRYRPVVLAATAILVTVAVLPGATGGSGPAAPAAFDAGPADGVAGVAAPGAGASEDTGSAASPVGSPAPAPAPRPAPAGSSTSFTPPAPRTGSATPSTATRAPAPSPVATGPSDAATTDDGSAPLQIVVSAWASTTGGTPLPTDVPDGSLPVGARIGQVDKASYIRLDGGETVLVLTEIADGRRGSDFETSPVQACQITDTGWEAGEDLSFDEAPAHDPADCVAATQADDGTWSIPLAGFADPTDDRGIALVPAADAPLDFQVTFASVVAG